MNVIPEDMLVHFVDRDDFCYPEWRAISQKVKTLDLNEEQLAVFWRELVLVWLGRVRVKLAGDYKIFESKNFFVLADSTEKPVMEYVVFLEKSRTKFHQVLGDLAWKPGHGKHVAIIFDEGDDFYNYISGFHAEGEYGRSGGNLLTNSGYIHMAVPFKRTVILKRLAFLLGLNCLARAPRPNWLGVALGEYLEDLLVPVSAGFFRERVSHLNLDPEDCQKHDEYWNETTIQNFWHASSWHDAGEANKLSYQLSRILFTKINEQIRPSRENLLLFIKEAHRRDGGEAAARAHLKISLGDLVADFLGAGDWAPHPEQWAEKAPPVKKEGSLA